MHSVRYIHEQGLGVIPPGVLRTPGVRHTRCHTHPPEGSLTRGVRQSRREGERHRASDMHAHTHTQLCTWSQAHMAVLSFPHVYTLHTCAQSGEGAHSIRHMLLLSHFLSHTLTQDHTHTEDGANAHRILHIGMWTHKQDHAHMHRSYMRAYRITHTHTFMGSHPHTCTDLPRITHTRSQEHMHMCTTSHTGTWGHMHAHRNTRAHTWYHTRAHTWIQTCTAPAGQRTEPLIGGSSFTPWPHLSPHTPTHPQALPSHGCSHPGPRHGCGTCRGTRRGRMPGSRGGGPGLTGVDEASGCPLAELLRLVGQRHLHHARDVARRRLHADGVGCDQLGAQPCQAWCPQQTPPPIPHPHSAWKRSCIRRARTHLHMQHA